MTEEEIDLKLIPREISNRERCRNQVIQFELNVIKEHFDKNILSVKEKFDLVEKLKNENNLQYKDILRTQIVFLDSAFDFFMHEITKYGMVKIYEGSWPKTAKYQNFTICLEEMSKILQNPEQENWFLDIVNNSYANDTFMSSAAVEGQLKLIGLNIQKVADGAFYNRDSNVKTKNKFRTTLNRLFYRRNQIAHQADCLHTTGEKIDISIEQVEMYIEDIEKIVESILKEIENIDNI